MGECGRGLGIMGGIVGRERRGRKYGAMWNCDFYKTLVFRVSTYSALVFDLMNGLVSEVTRLCFFFFFWRIGEERRVGMRELRKTRRVSQ